MTESAAEAGPIHLEKNPKKTKSIDLRPDFFIRLLTATVFLSAEILCWVCIHTAVLQLANPGLQHQTHIINSKFKPAAEIQKCARVFLICLNCWCLTWVLTSHLMCGPSNTCHKTHNMSMCTCT